jgi:NADH-quinone oxidoreductase subunit N
MVELTLSQALEHVLESLAFFKPELALMAGVLVIVTGGFFSRNVRVFSLATLVLLGASLILNVLKFQSFATPFPIFGGMLRVDLFSSYLNIVLDAGGILAVLMSWMYFGSVRTNAFQEKFIPEYFSLILAVVWGGHLLVMSTNLLMAFISLEIISISSYVLAGFMFDKKSTEGSLKYFLFGSTASAVMLYGFSLLYGFTGTLDFTSEAFFKGVSAHPTPLFFIAGIMALAGFLYKIAAAPMHPWSPDVYDAAPMPVVAFFSVVPKLAGIGILTRFILTLNLFGHSPYDWQSILSVVALLTMTVGNFSALVQKSPKRLMAYSSIAQSGFLLVGIVAFLPQGVEFMLFYATVYLFMNFLVFLYLQYFESQGFTTIASYQKAGFKYLWPAVFLLVGLIALTGLPPTAGFTAKLFVFSALWESYQLSGKVILLWLLVIGLLNTVVSLFYYLRIPYFALIKSGESATKTNFISESSPSPTTVPSDFLMGNLLGLILVIVLLLIFFIPGLLMGWINKINFVL